MPDEYTEEWQEAMTTAPPGRLAYRTLEIMHQTFDVPWRIVTGLSPEQAAAIEFGIEDDAIFNPGEMVNFDAVPFRDENTEFAVGRTPECTVTFDNVAREMMEPLMAAVAVQANLTVIYREYVADPLGSDPNIPNPDDLAEPATRPCEFVMSNVKIKGTTVYGLARIDNLSNKKFPSRVYTLSEFPGLLPG